MRGASPRAWSLAVSWFRPKPGKKEFVVPAEMWDRVLGLFKLKDEQRLYQDAFTLTLFYEPADLAAAVDSAQGLAGDAQESTASDREGTRRRVMDRREKREDNRRFGGWQYGRD